MIGAALEERRETLKASPEQEARSYYVLMSSGAPLPIRRSPITRRGLVMLGAALEERRKALKPAPELDQGRTKTETNRIFQWTGTNTNN